VRLVLKMVLQEYNVQIVKQVILKVGKENANLTLNNVKMVLLLILILKLVENVMKDVLYVLSL
jgi:hypothetical protein